MGQGVVRVAGAIAVAAPILGHGAVSLGLGYGTALGFAAVQAVAGGMVLWRVLPRARWVGPGAAAVLLAGLAVGARWSAEIGVLAGAGLSHAMLYGGLLAVFAGSLRPGRVSVVTDVAARVNRGFHPGMVPYTRGVTAAWCLLFGGELVASGGLLVLAPGVWRGFVGFWHVMPPVVLMLGELLVRRWRWRHQPVTGLVDTIRGFRASRPE